MATDSQALTTTPIEHSPVAGLSARRARAASAIVVLGMLLFITSEVMFFAGLFAAYFNVRANAAIVAARSTRRRPSPVPARDPAASSGRRRSC